MLELVLLLLGEGRLLGLLLELSWNRQTNPASAGGGGTQAVVLLLAGLCCVLPSSASFYSRALLSASVLRLLEMSRLLKRHTTLASTFPLAVCGQGGNTGVP